MRFADVPDAFDPQTAYSAGPWRSGAADLDGDLLPEIYFANDFGPDRLLHNRLDAGASALRRAGGAADASPPRPRRCSATTPSRAWGSTSRDLNGDGIPDMYVSNIAQNYALRGEPLRLGEHRRPRGDAARASPPTGPQRGRSACRAAAGAGTPASPTSTTTACPRRCRRSASCAARRTAGRSCTSSPWATTTTCSIPGAWPHFKPGDDLSGHLHNPFFVRARDGRYYDLAAELGLDDSHVSRGIAIADVDGDGALDFAIANQWEPSDFFHNDSPRRGSSLEIVPAAAGRRGDGRRHAAGGGRRRPRSGSRDGRRLVGQVDGGSGHSGKRAPELHFGLGRLGAGTPLRVDLRWRDGAGRVRAETLRLAPGWHTILLGWTDGRASSGRGRRDLQDATCEHGKGGLIQMAEKSQRKRTCAWRRCGASPSPSRSSTSSATRCSASSSRWAQPLVALLAAYATEILLERWSRAGSAAGPASSAAARRSSTSCSPAHITGLAVAMLLYANDRLLPIAFAAAVAIGSKHLFRVGTNGGQPALLQPLEPGDHGDAARLPLGRHRAALHVHREPQRRLGLVPAGGHRLLGHVPQLACSPSGSR